MAARIEVVIFVKAHPTSRALRTLFVTVVGMTLTKRLRLLKRTATNYSSMASYGHTLKVFPVGICVGPVVATIHMRPLYLA